MRIHVSTVVLLLILGNINLRADEISVNGNFKWGKKGDTITGTLTPTGADGEYTVKLMPNWKKKPKKGYNGTLKIDADGNVTGKITHKKEGAYTLTGKKEGDKISCQYKGKKSKKGDNPVNLTIKQ